MEKATLAGKTTQNNKIVQFESPFFSVDYGLKTFFIRRRAIQAALI